MWYGYGYGYDGFRGSTLRQRLLGFARAGTLVTVSVNRATLTGRIVAVDIDNFEMVVHNAIVNVSFRELNFIAVGTCEKISVLELPLSF